MSAVMSLTDRTVRPLTVGRPPKTSDSASDWALVGKNSFSFAGRFRINNDLPVSVKEGQLLHGQMDVASVPSFERTTEARNYSLVGACWCGGFGLREEI